MDIERELKAALAAEPPDPGFEERVRARLARPAPHAAAPRRSWRVPASLAAAVLAVAFGLHWHLERQRAAEAHQQLVMALAITSGQLNAVQQKLNRSEFPQENAP